MVRVTHTKNGRKVMQVMPEAIAVAMRETLDRVKSTKKPEAFSFNVPDPAGLAPNAVSVTAIDPTDKIEVQSL